MDGNRVGDYGLRLLDKGHATVYCNIAVGNKTADHRRTGAVEGDVAAVYIQQAGQSRFFEGDIAARRIKGTGDGAGQRDVRLVENDDAVFCIVTGRHSGAAFEDCRKQRCLACELNLRQGQRAGERTLAGGVKGVFEGAGSFGRSLDRNAAVYRNAGAAVDVADDGLRGAAVDCQVMGGENAVGKWSATLKGLSGSCRGYGIVVHKAKDPDEI